MGAFRIRDALGAAIHSGRSLTLRRGGGGSPLGAMLLIIIVWIAWGFLGTGLAELVTSLVPWLGISSYDLQKYLLYLIGGYVLIRTGRALYLRTFGRSRTATPRGRTDRPRLEWKFMGSATFAYDAELEQAGFYDRQPGGIPLGRFHRWHDRGMDDDLAGDALWYNGDKHGMTIAPTRGGKGESFVIPAALGYEGSLFIIDPKGQAAAVTARHRARPKEDGGLGQKVYILNPWDLHAAILNDPVRNPLVRSAHFNPMEALDGADDGELLDGAMMLAEALVPSQDGETKPFFTLSARDLVTALILYVATSHAVAERSLRQVRGILTNPEALDAVLDEIMGLDPHALVRQKAARFAELVEQDGERRYRYSQQESAQDVIATAIVNTSLLDSPVLARTMGDSDFSFEALKSAEEPVTIYLVIPASRIETYNRWLRLLVSVALRSLIDATEKPKIPVLFILDEFYQLGALQKVQDAMSLMAGYGVKLWPIVQDLNQLRARYSDKLWETFISNSGCIQMFKPNDNYTASYFSKRMGDMTDWGVSTNESFSSGDSSSKGTNSKDVNESKTKGASSNYSEAFTLTPHKRPLRTPDELTRMDRMHSLLFVDGAEVIQGERVRYHQEGATAHLADLDPEYYGLRKAMQMP